MVSNFRPRHLAKARKAQRRAYERQPWRAEDRKFYQSPAWVETRLAKLALNPVCEECERQGITTLASQVHHIKERKDHPDLAFEIGNLESLCLPCHNGMRKGDS